MALAWARSLRRATNGMDEIGGRWRMGLSLDSSRRVSCRDVALDGLKLPFYSFSRQAQPSQMR
jgi:hypothetical protein